MASNWARIYLYLQFLMSYMADILIYTGYLIADGAYMYIRIGLHVK